MQATPDSLWQSPSLKVAVFTALGTAIVALVKGGWALYQQCKEMRWKQAELGRDLLDRWFSWQASHNALRMVDEGAGRYTVDGYGTHQVYPESDIPTALAVEGSMDNWQSVSNTAKDRLIRKCFDVLFYSFERIQHSINIGVVKRNDVMVPADYYVGQLARFYVPIATYMRYSGFSRAKQFLRSFEQWRETARCHDRLVDLRTRLSPAFALDTAYPGTDAGEQSMIGSTGHCAVVAAIVQSELGGQLLSTHVDGEVHWFNRVPAGCMLFDVDLTGDQFGGPEVGMDSPGNLHPNAVERSFTDLREETRERARRLAQRAGLSKIARQL